MSKKSLTDLLETLEYGPAPEDDTPAKDWIKKHNGKFGLFINGEMQYPEGRSFSPSSSPARFGGRGRGRGRGRGGGGGRGM